MLHDRLGLRASASTKKITRRRWVISLVGFLVVFFGLVFLYGDVLSGFGTLPANDCLDDPMMAIGCP